MRLDETVVNFTSHRGHQIPAFRILRWGGRYQALGPAYLWLYTRGDNQRLRAIFGRCADPAPKQTVPKKTPGQAGGEGFPCDSARRGKESRRIDRPTIGLPARLCQPITLSLPFRNSHAIVARWASSHMAMRSALERSAPWSQRVWQVQHMLAILKSCDLMDFPFPSLS